MAGINRATLLRKLAELDIPVVLIGAQALRVYGSSRETMDIDFAARAIDVDGIVELMYKSGYRIPVSVSKDGNFATWAASAAAAKRHINAAKLGALNFYYLDKSKHPVDQIDFVFENPVPFMRLLQRALVVRKSPKLLCASIDDLITMKEKLVKTNRNKPSDVIDLDFLRQKKAEV